MIQTESQQKQETAEQYAARGEFFVAFDPRQPGVSVPAQLAQGERLQLKFSHRYDTGKLDVSEWGIRQGLSFAGHVYRVAVPWSAIFAIWSKPAQQAREFAKPEPVDTKPALTMHRGLRLVN